MRKNTAWIAVIWVECLVLTMLLLDGIHLISEVVRKFFE